RLLPQPAAAAIPRHGCPPRDATNRGFEGADHRGHGRIEEEELATERHKIHKKVLAFVMLVAHCVDHEIQRYADGETGVFFGVTIEIHEFPSVTQIGVVGDDDQESPIVVGYPINSWVDIVGLLPSPATETPLSLIRSLDDFIDIEKAVK